MAIISFEEIEQQVVEQESPVETAMDKELLEESIENSNDQLDALEQLDEAIEKQDELISDVEEGKKDLEEVKEDLHESMIAAEHFCQVLGKTSLKSIAGLRNANLSFESINSNPLEALKDFNGVLKSVRKAISQEAVEEVTKGWLEKFSNLFRGIDSQYKRYKAMSSEMVKLIEANKAILEVKPGMELSSANSALVGTTVVDVAKNFAEFVDKYTEALENPEKSVKMNLKHLKDFKDLSSDAPGLAPVGFAFGKSSSGRKLKLTCATPDLDELFTKGVKDESEVRKSKLGFEDTLVDPKKQLTFKSVEELLKTLKSLDAIMEEHFKIVDKPIRAKFANGKHGLGRYLGMGIGGYLAYDEGKQLVDHVRHGLTNNTAPGLKARLSSLTSHVTTPHNVKSMAANLAVAAFGVGAALYLNNKRNGVSKELYNIAKSHMVWNDLVVVQREIVNMLQVKEDVGGVKESDFLAKLGLAMHGDKVD